MPGWYRWDDADLVLHLKLKPKSSRDAFGEIQQDRIRVRITAPPVDGKANTHLVAWLAKQFAVTRSAIAIESGTTSPLKRVRIRAPLTLPADIAQSIRRS